MVNVLVQGILVFSRVVVDIEQQQKLKANLLSQI